MRVIDLTGQRFGRLKVLERDWTKSRTYWICRCDCGKEKSIQSVHLRSGASTSCGCYQKEKASEANLTHGKTHTPLHNRWKAMRQRCNNPSDRRYCDYGGRGISVCKEWEDFSAFSMWAKNNGYVEGLEIDRIDNDKGYCPENCRWVTSLVNNNNKRNTASIEGLTLTEFAEKHNMTRSLVHTRYYQLKKYGKPITAHNIVTYANQLPLNGESH